MTPDATVLVTGAGGFAGGHLLERLAGRCEIVAWARSQPAAGLRSLARWVSVDLLDRDRVRREIQDLRPGAVFHCAGASQVAASWQRSAESLAGNALATHHLLDALRRAGVGCRVLVTGSAAVYAASESPLREDDPLAPASPYAVSKLAQEELALRTFREDGIAILMTRPFNHTGPRQSPDFVAPAIARQIALIERGAAEPVIGVGNLDARRDLTDVRDTVRAYDLLMEQGTPGVVHNVASGVARSVREILEALCRRSSVRVDVRVDPERLRPHDAPVVVGDAARLRAATGWVPAITFDQTMDDLLAYWRQVVGHAPLREQP